VPTPTTTLWWEASEAAAAEAHRAGAIALQSAMCSCCCYHSFCGGGGGGTGSILVHLLSFKLRSCFVILLCSKLILLNLTFSPAEKSTKWPRTIRNSIKFIIGFLKQFFF